MKKFVKIASLFLCITMLMSLSVFTACSNNKSGEGDVTTEESETPRIIKIAVTTDNKPYCFYKEDNITGILVDILADFTTGTNATLELKDIKEEEIISGLINGDYNAAVVDFVPEDSEIADRLVFSTAIFSERECVVTKIGAGIYNVGALTGKTVGVVAGTASESSVPDKLGADNVKVYETSAALADALIAGDVMAGITDEDTAGSMRTDYADLTVISEYFSDKSYTLCTLKSGSYLADSMTIYANALSADDINAVVEKYLAD